ncbi:MAG TPA: host attachment protein [Chroococcales cyanobacterium]|jgi:protein required for attachment to host cells
MSQFLVAVIDGTRARFFTLEQAEIPEFESGPNLIEHEGLFNELSGKELWSSVRTGRNQGSASQAHAYDDGRNNQVVEFGRRFAQMIATELLNLIQVCRTQRVILIAEPRILGILREALAPLLPKNLQIQELTKDLCKLKPLELHEHLATKNFLPARKRVFS